MQKALFLIPEKYLGAFTVCCSPQNYRDQLSDCWHYHDFDELVVVCSGEGMHVTEHGTYPVRRGDVFLIPYGASHGYEQLKNFSIANLIFHLHEWRRKWGDLTDSIGYNIFFENNVTFQEKYRFRNRLTLDAEELEKCESIFSQMLREQTIRSSGCRAMNEALFMELCVLICRAFSRAERKSLSEISNLSRLLEFMKRHYMEELPLPELARRGHCSVSSLCRLFRSALGRSPGEYLNTLRLERAAKELRETEKSISAIAFSCGFQDSNYFSFRFSRHFGCSPREYRRMCSGERPDRPR